MHDPPPSVYENWPAPNYVDPVTRGSALIIINSVAGAFAVLVVLARVYTRTRITGSFGLDDVFICLALIPSLGLTGCTLASELVYGWNRHIWDATAEQMHGGLIMEFSSGILYIQSSLLTKMSVIFFCRRLITDSHPSWYRRGLDGFAVATFVGNMAYTLTFCLSCEPLHAYWDGIPPLWKPDYPYHCIDIGALWLSGSILNASWDLLTWLAPLPIVLKLHLPLRQRIAVMALFALGLAVVIAGALKTVYVQIAFNESYDVTWTGYPLWICGALEIDVGILCASIPSLRPLFSHFCPRVVGGGAGGGHARWAMRKSYSRMSKGKDSLGEEATPLSPLSPLSPMSPMSPLSPAHLKIETEFTTDHMKPWSRGRSQRNSVNKFEISPITPLSPIHPTSPRRLTPLGEMLPMTSDVAFNKTPALLPPDHEAIQRHLEEPEMIPLPTSPTGLEGSRKVLGYNTKPMAPSIDTASLNSKSTYEMESPVSKRSHSRKTSAAAEFEGFNFNLPSTSSRRTSQGTAPPSYGDFVSQNSFVVPEETQEEQ